MLEWYTAGPHCLGVHSIDRRGLLFLGLDVGVGVSDSMGASGRGLTGAEAPSINQPLAPTTGR